MSDDIKKKVETFNAVITYAGHFLGITRDSELQRDAVAKLRSLHETVSEWKSAAIARRNEDQANLFLGMQCLADSYIAEITMWLMLKADKPDEAWDQLVTAQLATIDTLRAHPCFTGVDKHAEHLHMIEKTVFPKQVFLSAGLLVQRELCSICDCDYGDCSHVVGRPYMGEFCSRRLLDFIPDHVAIVDDPANKRCRVTHFDDAGGKRNRMTWRVEPVENSTPPESGKPDGLTVSAILLHKDDIDKLR